jgi:hypothetical protein
MMELTTIFTSNIPLDCYILKGRLERDGLVCFIYDENIVWVHPFKAVAVGGVKLKVPTDQVALAEQIMRLIKQNKLIDENGEYELSTAFEMEMNRQNEILRIKTLIRKNPSLIEKPDEIQTVFLNHDDMLQLIDDEKKFVELTNAKMILSREQFWYELLDFNRSIFKYFRIRPVEYYIEKELVDRCNSEPASPSNIICPECNSEDVRYGYAIDYKLDILYLIFSFLLFAPFPPIRKKHHCFNCGFDFKENVN